MGGEEGYWCRSPVLCHQLLGHIHIVRVGAESLDEERLLFPAPAMLNIRLPTGSATMRAFSSEVLVERPVDPYITYANVVS